MGRIVQFRVSYSQTSAPVTLSLTAGRLPENAMGITELTFTEELIVNAKIKLTRSQYERTPFLVNDLANTTAHEIGLRSTATVMYGHIETVEQVANHLNLVRDIQKRTGGFTEFVPLGFIHEKNVLFNHMNARPGASGPPLAVKRVPSPRFPLDFSIGPEDRMIAAIPFAGPLRVTVRIDSDGNATTRSPGDLQGAAEGTYAPGDRGVSVVVDEVL